ncbi:putative toxin-antitoxin system toxin component, PIN family [Candidatus Pacearchaeota archaeon]|nr:putative toxin-antitoxin system toxin component, PIN family [Candidatus Pacearchaeota archaeon]
MKVVLDTNVWLSALFWEGEANKIVELIEKKKINVIISEKILNEIADVLKKEAKFHKFIDDKNENIKDVIRTILYLSDLIDSKTEINTVKEDPSDDKIIETAIDGKASYIVSYNNHLLKLKEFGKIKIIHPKEFLKRFRK